MRRGRLSEEGGDQVKKRYLGDGCYVDHDGFNIILTAEDGHPRHGVG